MFPYVCSVNVHVIILYKLTCVLLCGFRCGLAEQLDRLLSQQRSDKTLWYHQVFRQHDHQGDERCAKLLRLQN